jgi:SAM-dependent methyltransferase
VIRVSPEEGYRLWAQGYDEGPNPLPALETRVVRGSTGPLAELDGGVFLDAATGTGRWLKYALSRGSNAFGIDLSPEMLCMAARDSRLRARLIRGDVRALPFPDRAVGIAICSFTLGYLESPAPALTELARVASRVIVSDLHPRAVAAGWTRSFRAGGERYEIEHCAHSVHDIDSILQKAGLRRDWFVEARFGPPEEAIFGAAGKAAVFPELARIPAIFVGSWIL